MRDPTTRPSLTPCDLVAAALALPGCKLLVDVAMPFVAIQSDRRASSAADFTFPAALAVTFVLLRNVLARWLTAKDSVAGWLLDRRQIQRTGIALLGVHLLASGLRGA